MNELDNLLKSLRKEQASAKDIAQWKLAVAQIGRRETSRWIELVAAVLVGVLIGSTMFHKQSSEENFAKDATIERVITKIE